MASIYKKGNIWYLSVTLGKNRLTRSLPGGRIDDTAAGKDLLSDGLWSGRCDGTRQIDLPLQSCEIELEQPSPVDDLAGDGVLPLLELIEGDRLSGDQSLENREICTGQQSQIVAVLLINPFDILGEDQVDSSTQFRVRRRLTAGPLAPSLTTDGGSKSALLDGVPGDRKLPPSGVSNIGELSEGFVVIVANVGRCDLIGGDVVAIGHSVIERKIGPRQLLEHRLGIIDQMENSSI